MNLDHVDEDLLVADGYDDCILGVAYENGRVPRVAYDRAKMIEQLMEDMTREDAEEYFEYNIAGAYVGENTPTYIETNP